MINDKLKELQLLKREDSIERVSWAIQFLKDTEGKHNKITAVKISSVTGLSRAVLYKPHLRILWDKKYDELMKNNKIPSRQNLQQEKLIITLQEKITLLEMKISKGENIHSKLLEDIEKEKTRSRVYRDDYDDLKERHQKLLYYNLRILRKLHIQGIDISQFNDFQNDFNVELDLS
ncbi:hypothetical protein KQ941_01915 [Paenibacillus xylanexedens]|uniref:DUF6262 family protein n=1 Tax=Paenibacillus xylanexedens TaxID=528191 RepID=UPI001F364CD0|nr:DUF6262 family protein [Paenibacillus xylanexedens]MCF7753182.1 hypothetical protein [Paenibacillus xylanexedens]